MCAVMFKGHIHYFLGSIHIYTCVCVYIQYMTQHRSSEHSHHLQ